MLGLVSKFIGFVTGFAMIALYWVAHHRIFRFLRNYDQKLLWLNFQFLLCIVLMPFSSGLFSSYAIVKAPFTIYIINLLLTALAQVRLSRYLANPAHHLIHPADAAPDLDWWRPLVPAAGSGLALPVALFIPSNSWLRSLTPFLLMLTIPFTKLYQRRLQAQHLQRAKRPRAEH